MTPQMGYTTLAKAKRKGHNHSIRHFSFGHPVYVLHVCYTLLLRWGHTPLAEAEREGHTKVADFLRTAMDPTIVKE